MGTKPVICDHKLMIIPLNNEREAYFVAGILNSLIVKATVRGYTIETTMDTHITRHIRVPDFNVKDPLHLKLADLLKRAHELAAKNEDTKLAKVEKQIDNVVEKIYGQERLYQGGSKPTRKQDK